MASADLVRALNTSIRVTYSNPSHNPRSLNFTLSNHLLWVIVPMIGDLMGANAAISDHAQGPDLSRKRIGTDLIPQDFWNSKSADVNVIKYLVYISSKNLPICVTRLSSTRSLLATSPSTPEGVTGVGASPLLIQHVTSGIQKRKYILIVQCGKMILTTT